MVLIEKPLLSEDDLPPRIKGIMTSASGGDETLKGAAQSAAGTAEKAMIEKALRDAGGNRTAAAQALGISRKTLFNKMKAFRMDG
jgi:DNA-binding NtrC family response regulator